MGTRKADHEAVQVRNAKISALYADGLSIRIIGERFGLNRSTVQDILRYNRHMSNRQRNENSCEGYRAAPMLCVVRTGEKP